MNSWLTPDHILPILTTFLGGGASNLLVRLWFRKSEVRNLRQTGDATMLSSANTYVDTLQEQITKLNDRMTVKDSEHAEDKKNLSEQLTRAHDENRRLSNMVASLQTDLDIARGQIAQLQSRMI
jgi:chromosome segregation ATPase